jgi:hypothetical protein
MAGSVNNPPAPALEGINVGLPGDDCATIKADFGITTRPHGDGSKRESANPPDKGHESHHILQDAAIDDKINRKLAQAILLTGPFGEHVICNRRQNARNCGRASIPASVADARAKGLPDAIAGGPAVPAASPSTFGELKKAAKGDVVAGLQGRRKHKTEDRPMTREEAEIIADCIIAEAEKAINEECEKQGKPNMKDSDSVNNPGPCLSPGTLVWLDSGHKVPIEQLKRGAKIETDAGVLEIQRTDICYGALTELEVSGERLRMTPFHYVCDTNGSSVRADELKVGNVLKMSHGSGVVSSIRAISGNHAAITFGACTSCKFGRNGVWVEFPDTGIRVIGTYALQKY